MRIQLIRYHDIANVNTRLAHSLNKRQGVLPPLGVAYIAASLERAGYEVDLVDAIALELTREQVKQRIRDFGPELVGITAMTPVFRGALEAASIAKQQGCLTVVGGTHLSLFPHETLSFDCIDYGILGEGEQTIVELAKAIERKQSPELIPGLACKTHQGIRVNAPRIVEDLDSLPFPSYHLLPMHKYSSIIGMHPVSTIMGSRGCPYKCGFCYKTPSDRKHRKRDPKSIVDEMEMVVRKYHVKEIMFYDDLMLPDHVVALCQEILRRGLRVRWQSPQRVNLVRPDLLALMAKAGCHMLRFGVEQGDLKMMQLIEKNITIDAVKRAFRWTHDAGIDTFAYFVIGYIHEDARTMKATVDLAKELNPRYVMFTKAVPLPNTRLMDMAVEAGLIDKDYWRRFSLGEDIEPIVSLTCDADEWVKRAYRQFYLRPTRIVKQIGMLRSMTDLRKNLSGLIGLIRFRMTDDE